MKLSKTKKRRQLYVTSVSLMKPATYHKYSTLLPMIHAVVYFTYCVVVISSNQLTHLTPWTNGRQFDRRHFSNTFSSMKSFVIRFDFHFVQFTIGQHWFKYWFGTKPATSHYLNKHCRNSLTHLQYIPRNMHTVFALLCFVVVINWLIFPYPSGLLHWHCGNLTIAPVPAKQPWWI